MSITTDIEHVRSKLSEIEQRMSKIDHLNVSMVYRGNVSITDIFDKRTDPVILIDNNPYPYVAVVGDVVTYHDSIYLYDGDYWSEIKNTVTTVVDSDVYMITTSAETIRDQIDSYMQDYIGKLAVMSCNNCGGNIDLNTMLCKSCGTQYRLEISRRLV